MILESTLAVLRAIKDHGPICTHDLEVEMGRPPAGCKSALNLLQNTHKLIEVYGGKGGRRIYTVNDDGLRLIRLMDGAKEKKAGEFPTPRTAVTFVPLKFKPMVAPRGEASMRAYDICSNVDGVQVPRNPPRSICGRVDVIGWRMA